MSLKGMALAAALAGLAGSQGAAEEAPSVPSNVKAFCESAKGDRVAYVTVLQSQQELDQLAGGPNFMALVGPNGRKASAFMGFSRNADGSFNFERSTASYNIKGELGSARRFCRRRP